MLLAIGMRERRCAPLHRRAQDIDPARKRHVERRLMTLLIHRRHDPRQFQLLHQADRSLEMLVPWNIRQRVVEAPYGALEEDHAQSCLEDLLVLFVAVQCGAELGDGGVAMAHDVVVYRLVLDVICRFVVLRRDGEAAVQVAFIGFQSGENE